MSDPWVYGTMLQVLFDDGWFRVRNLSVAMEHRLYLPVFEIGNEERGGESLHFIGIQYEKLLLNGGTEMEALFGFKDLEGMRLRMQLRCFPGSPILRYRYILQPKTDAVMTKITGKDRILYSGISLGTKNALVCEIQFSQFAATSHAYLPEFQYKDVIEDGTCYPGPITLLEEEGACCLLAYEHGAEYPDTFLEFYTKLGQGTLEVHLKACKGNYYHGQQITRDRPFLSPWFHFAACSGKREDLLKHYRRFFLEYICENNESRKPYIFYNTWNGQERGRYFNNLPFLHSMRQEAILLQIDVAHRMGIDVFVIDAGWFGKTGDWEVNCDRFPDGLKAVRERLDSYGMKLGLWFNPVVAAKTSLACREHPEFVASIDGKKSDWGPIWETEESYGMCLASGYSDYFIRKLVQLHCDLGVSYFKWDAVDQYMCNSPLHHHGTEANSLQERLECYSYQMGMEMIRIADEVIKQCPGVIIDSDITEPRRFMGLGFLSVGKYFHINNGPYANDFDIPEDFRYLQQEPVRMDPMTNLLFYPGPARSRICRQSLRYDGIVPSILFLSHFLPDPPVNSQMNSLASLVLGGNGVWGDLLSLREEDMEWFGRILGKYKTIAGYVTSSYPKVKGFIGASPEIYEKIDYKEAKGLVCFFTRAAGTFVHVTEKVNTEGVLSVEGADSYEVTGEGRLKITVSLDTNQSRIVFIF